MSQELERVYTINLGKVLLSPDNRRSKRAINMIKEFARHHMKTEDVKIDEELAHQVWQRGIRHPPRKIRVRMTKTEEGFVLISTYEEEIAKVKPEEQEKVEEKKEEKPVEEIKPLEVEKISEIKEKPKEIPKKPSPQKEKPKTITKKQIPKQTKETTKETKKTPSKEKPKKKSN